MGLSVPTKQRQSINSTIKSIFVKSISVKRFRVCRNLFICVERFFLTADVFRQIPCVQSVKIAVQEGIKILITKGCIGDTKMDKQTNILSNTQNLIPVNTRTIGAPEGIYILYLEDYVHTFIKKILSVEDEKPHPEIALYGRSVEESGRFRIVVSGAAALEGGGDRIQQLNNTYFPSCAYIGNAKPDYNKDLKLRIELTLRSTKVILDDFYIYYDQNEEMQNYLVEWNTTRDYDKNKVILSPTEQEPLSRAPVKDAAHLSRITQAYNREEAKIGFMWNVMNVLCLGFVVCIMAYGIISMNNYNKMQNMQKNIDYCLAFVAENTSLKMTGQEAIPTMQQSVQSEKEAAAQSPQDVSLTGTKSEQQPQDTQSAKTEQPQDSSPTQPQDEPVSEPAQTPQQPAQAAQQPQDTLSAEAAQPTQQPQDTLSAEAEQPSQDMASAVQSDAAQEIQTTQSGAAQVLTEPEQTPSTPQYYVVRKGDTLRTICYEIYGDYSRVEEICQWNQIENPDNILYGQKLLLP